MGHRCSRRQRRRNRRTTIISGMGQLRPYRRSSSISALPGRWGQGRLVPDALRGAAARPSQGIRQCLGCYAAGPFRKSRRMPAQHRRLTAAQGAGQPRLMPIGFPILEDAHRLHRADRHARIERRVELVDERHRLPVVAHQVAAGGVSGPMRLMRSFWAVLMDGFVRRDGRGGALMLRVVKNAIRKRHAQAKCRTAR